MSEEPTAGTGTEPGEPAGGPGAQITATGTGTGDGQPQAGPSRATTKGDGTQQAEAEDSFFDPSTIKDKPELLAAYKQMQKAFSQKTADIKKHRQKVDAYDAFMRDPVSELQRMAGQMGYRLTRADAEAAVAKAGDGGATGPQWQPQTWDEVLSRAEQRAIEKVRAEFAPMFGQIQELRKSNLEKFLDDNAPDWRQYEEAMVEKLRNHPSLVNDPVSLYRMSVPAEVLESRAMQAALKKLEAKTQSSKVAGPSQTTRQPKTGFPDKPISFDEAVKLAKTQLAEKGIRPQ